MGNHGMGFCPIISESIGRISFKFQLLLALDHTPRLVLNFENILTKMLYLLNFLQSIWFIINKV